MLAVTGLLMVDVITQRVRLENLKGTREGGSVHEPQLRGDRDSHRTLGEAENHDAQLEWKSEVRRKPEQT